MMEARADLTGAAITASFDVWVVELQSSRAQIAKQGRLMREEAAFERKNIDTKTRGVGKAAPGHMTRKTASADSRPRRGHQPGLPWVAPLVESAASRDSEGLEFVVRLKITVILFRSRWRRSSR